MEYLVEQSRRVDSFHEPILNRGDLDPSLTQRMFMWVSAALRQYILDTYEMEPDRVDDLLETAALEAIGSGSQPAGSSSKAQRTGGPVGRRQRCHSGDAGRHSSRKGKFTLVHDHVPASDGAQGTAGQAPGVRARRRGIGDCVQVGRVGQGDLLVALHPHPQGQTRRRKVAAPRYSSRPQPIRPHDRRASARHVVRRRQRNVGYLAAIRELEITTVAHG